MNPAYESEYDETLSLSRKWVYMAEEINKVNWFLKIREQMRKKFSV